MRRVWRAMLVLLATFVVGAAILLTAAYRASQAVPEFYEAALVSKPVQQKAAADALERQVLHLHNEVRRPGRWEARFSQDQINGWLAADLPAKFPGALPRGVSDPRVNIQPEKMQLAVRYQQGDVLTVLSLAGDAYLTDRPNEIAVRIERVRAGAVPVPLGQFLEKIAERATDAGLPLRWTEEDGDPVAIVALPLHRREFRGRNLQVDKLEIGEGEIVVSGQTEMLDEKTAQVPGSDGGPSAAEAPDTNDTHQR
jgi:hypothetical protein